jgi:hypothetical protein
MRIVISQNFPEVQRQLDQLRADYRDNAAVSAVNKTLAKAKTSMTRAIAGEFNIVQAKVRDQLKIDKAKFVGGKAVITGVLDGSSGKRRGINLIAFIEKSSSLAQVKKRARAGVLNQLHFQIKRKGGKVTIPGAFIGNKGRTVFKRVGKSRLPIKAMTTIGIEQMFNTKRIHAVVVQAMERDFPEIFEREAKYYTDRFNSQRAAA